MYPFKTSGDSVAAILTGFASNVTGASFALSATTVSDGLAHKVTVKNDAATDHSGKTIALVGTDADGRPQTETLTGPAGTATVTSSKYFKSLTSPLLPSATIGTDTFDIGYAADSVSPTFWPINEAKRTHGAFNIGFACVVDSGSPNYTVQHTYNGTTWHNHATVAAETTTQEGTYTSPVAGIRLLWTAAGGVSMTALQVAD